MRWVVLRDKLLLTLSECGDSLSEKWPPHNEIWKLLQMLSDSAIGVTFGQQDETKRLPGEVCRGRKRGIET